MRSKKILIISSTLIVLIMLGVGLWGVIVDRQAHGGFVPNLGKAIALAVIGVLNLVLLGMTVTYWVRYGAPIWLKTLIYLQSAAAAWTVWMLSALAIQQFNQSRRQERMQQIRMAIRADDVARWQALSRGSMATYYSVDERLLDAVDFGAHRSMVALIADGAHSSVSLLAVRQTEYTCRGDRLYFLNAFKMAIVRNDQRAIDLLFSTADESIVQSAVWLAVRLNKVDIVKGLVARGVDVRSIRGEVLQENESLLVAAAQGAAVETAKWLIEEYGLAVNRITNGPDPYGGSAPLHALLKFADEVYAPAQTQAMLTLLVKHGASLEEPDHTGRTPLRQAIARRHRELADMLLAAGADRGGLDATEQVALQETLVAPLREPDEPRADCFDVDGSRVEPTP